MATVTPGRTGRTAAKSSRSSTTAGSRPTKTDIAPTPTRSLRLWLQAVLDRPLTSYHLVLGSASILVALGLMMVLSASSVSAFMIYDDAYFYVKRQAMFLVMGCIALVVYEKLGLRILRSAWINLDRIWAGTLIVTGAVTFVL